MIQCFLHALHVHSTVRIRKSIDKQEWSLTMLLNVWKMKPMRGHTMPVQQAYKRAAKITGASPCFVEEEEEEKNYGGEHSSTSIKGTSTLDEAGL